jgi:hypothetical protein
VALAYAAAKRTAAAVLATANTALLMRVDDLERQNALISRQTIPISAAFQATLIQDLTHFHTPEMDALLVKLGPPFVLTQREVDRLIMLLEERERDLGGDVGQGERDAARMLPMVIRRVAADQLRTGLHAEPLVRVFVNRAEVAGMQ